MTGQNESQVVGNDIVNAIQKSTAPNDEPSLEQLILLINTERVLSMEKKSQAQLDILKDRYSQVRSLNDLRKKINNALLAGTNIDITKDEELKSMLAKAKENGVPIVEEKQQYSKEEAELLLKNIKMSIDDLSIQNDLDLQKVSQYQSQHHDSYNLAISITKPLDAAKRSIARGIGGK